MKNILQLFATLLLTIPLFAQWVPQNSGTTTNLNDVYCITADFVVLVGDNGTILKTTDGGANWIAKTSGTTYKLKKIQFANSTTGYAVGFHGTLLKTIDAGNTWTALNSGTTENLYGLSVINENLFFISGTNGLLKKTLNAGATWTTLTTPSNDIVEDIQFFDDNHGYSLFGTDPYFKGGVLYKTSNGGDNWLQTMSGTTFSYFFQNFNIGYISIERNLFKTIDAFNSFIFLSGTSCPTYPSDIHVTQENIIWGVSNTAVIGYPFGTSRGEINSNQEFQQVCNTLSVALECVYFFNEMTGYTVGYNGAIFKNSTGILLSTNDTQLLTNIVISPNPSSSEFIIKSQNTGNQIFHLKLINSFGQEVLATDYSNQPEFIINVENLAKGIYFLQLSTSQNTFTQKMLVD